MARCCIFFLMLSSCLLSMTTSSAQVLHETLLFSASEVRFVERDGYVQVTMDGAELAGEPGEPQLPVFPVSLALPPGARVLGVELCSTEIEHLPGEHLIYPAQPAQILSATEKIAFAPPEPEIYESNHPFPGEAARYVGTGSLDGSPLANLLVFPLLYRPAEGALALHTRLDLAVRYALTSAKTRRPGKAAGDLLRRLASNEISSPSSVDDDLALPSGAFDYVIVTGQALESSFSPLAEWKTQKGIPATVVNTSWIYATYPDAADSQEMIRNFIEDAHQEWGTSWVLLGGDTDVVPARTAYALSGGFQGDGIPCDLYYADLDGDWNRDGDDIYGEMADSVDLYPDLFIGRASVEDVAEAQSWVAKVLTYEKSPPLDYTLDILFLAEILWLYPFTDSGVNKEMIDLLYIPYRFDPITKLYETLGNENKESVMAALNQGHHIVNHNGHASMNSLSVGNGVIGLADMDALINAPRHSILYSVGCWPAAFDYDCVAERFIANPNGGGVAFVGHSRYGWGSPGNPGYGYSDRFDQQFFRFLLHEEIHHIGLALAAAKAYYVPQSRGENIYRWHQYQLNLIGDPEMPVWTDIPRSATVTHPSTIPNDTSLFTVTVTVNATPIQGALVCFRQRDKFYHRGHTGPSGQVTFVVCPDFLESAEVTVTGLNLLPYEKKVLIETDGPYLDLWSWSIDDGDGGDGDGTINPGETIYLSATVRNAGRQGADSVILAMESDDTSVTMIDSQEECGDLPPGDSVACLGAFQFSVGPCTDEYPLPFTLTMTDDEGQRWTEILNLQAATPVLAYRGCAVDDSAGDGLLEPGEVANLVIDLGNEGHDRALGIVGHLSTDDDYIVIVDSIAYLGDCWPDSTVEGRFIVDISPLCPVPHFPVIDLWAIDDGGYRLQGTVTLTIGETDFADDVEGGSGNWAHGGTGDLWHITAHRSHSGDNSWYCGYEGSWQYEQYMNCWLASNPIVIGPESRLSFWRWFDVAVFGVNGIYVEVLHGTLVEKLDFIGSGGALDSLLMGDDWHQEEYDLSSYPVGDTVQVLFRFVSDDEPVAEGFYIDDIVVVGAGQGGWVSADEEAPPALPERFVLRQNCPNPFNPTTEIAYALPEECQVKLEIYNLLGQRVRTLVDEHQSAGHRTGRWDSRDQSGKEVASGVYLYRISAGDFVETRRMILLK